MSRTDSESNMRCADLGIDGNAGFALLGDDLQSGEAEFVTVQRRADETQHEAEVRAAFEAFEKLKARLRIPDLSYAWWPRRPGSSGA